MFVCLIRAASWEKQFFAFVKTKAQISCAVTAQLISAFVFATRIVQFLLYVYSKFQDSSHLLILYRPVCVRRGRKPQKPVFLRRGSFNVLYPQSTAKVLSGWSVILNTLYFGKSPMGKQFTHFWCRLVVLLTDNGECSSESAGACKYFHD